MSLFHMSTFKFLLFFLAAAVAAAVATTLCSAQQDLKQKLPELSEIYLSSGENEIGSQSVVATSDGRFILCATETSPAIIVKLDAVSRQRIAAVKLDKKDNLGSGGHDDPTSSTIAWWAVAHGVVEVDTAKMKKVRSLLLSFSGGISTRPSTISGHFSWLFVGAQVTTTTTTTATPGNTKKSFAIYSISKAEFKLATNDGAISIPSQARSLRGQGRFLYVACDSASAADGSASLLLKLAIGLDGSLTNGGSMRLPSRPSSALMVSTVSHIFVATANTLLQVSLDDFGSAADQIDARANIECLLFDGKSNFYIVSSSPATVTNIRLHYSKEARGGAAGGDGDDDSPDSSSSSSGLRIESALPLSSTAFSGGCPGGALVKENDDADAEPSNVLFLAFAGTPGRFAVVRTEDNGDLPEDAATKMARKRQERIREFEIIFCVLLIILLTVLCVWLYRKFFRDSVRGQLREDSLKLLWSRSLLNNEAVGRIVHGGQNDITMRKLEYDGGSSSGSINFSEPITRTSHPTLFNWTSALIRDGPGLGKVAKRREIEKVVFIQNAADTVERFIGTHRSESRARSQNSRLRIPPPRDADSVAALKALKKLFVDEPEQSEAVARTAAAAAAVAESATTSAGGGEEGDADPEAGFSRILFGWHGCPPSAVEGVIRHGPRSLRTTDGAFMGAGLYFSDSFSLASSYACLADASPGDEFGVILFALSISQAYPVTLAKDYNLVEPPDTPNSKRGFSRFYNADPQAAIALAPGYDSHFVPVKYYGSTHPRSGEKCTHNLDFQCCRADDAELAGHEIVISSHTRALPICVAYFKC